jgi:hypothetical protein
MTGRHVDVDQPPTAAVGAVSGWGPRGRPGEQGPAGERGPRGYPGESGAQPHIGSSPPPSPQEIGQLWVDTVSVPPELKYWDGTVWLAVPDSPRIYLGSDPPEQSPFVRRRGDIWLMQASPNDPNPTVTAWTANGWYPVIADIPDPVVGSEGRFTIVRLGSSGPTMTRGSGLPNSVQPAGSLYTRTETPTVPWQRLYWNADGTANGWEPLTTMLARSGAPGSTNLPQATLWQDISINGGWIWRSRGGGTWELMTKPTRQGVLTSTTTDANGWLTISWTPNLMNNQYSFIGNVWRPAAQGVDNLLQIGSVQSKAVNSCNIRIASNAGWISNTAVAGEWMLVGST